MIDDIKKVDGVKLAVSLDSILGPTIPDDMVPDEAKEIFKNGCVVTESDDIVYGGLRAADRKTHCLADDTLDTKLKEQKEWFLEHSGLSIEE